MQFAYSRRARSNARCGRALTRWRLAARLAAMTAWLALQPVGLARAADESPAAGHQAAPVAAPLPPRILFYFSYLPMPGVPAQYLPPPPPFFWPFPMLLILPPAPAPSAAPMPPLMPPSARQPGADGEPGPEQRASPPPLASAQPEAAQPAVAPNPAVAPQPSPGADIVADGVKPDEAPAEPRVTDAPMPSKHAPTSKAVVNGTAKVQAKPAPKRRVTKPRKLCWKDGRLDVCK